VLVTALPSTNRQNLQQVMAHVHQSVSNLWSGGAVRSAYERLLNYLDWANEAVRLLSSQVSPRDIDRLVLTPRYHTLLSGLSAYMQPETQRALNSLLSTELDQRTAAFAEACKVLDQHIDRWSRPGVFVLLDTGVYIHHEKTIDEIDLAPLIPVRHEPIHVLVPIVVIDELDGQKQNSKGEVRGRARQALAILDRVLQNPAYPARLREEDYSALDSGGIPRGEISIEVLFDPPGHTRLPINDDEIIDRALSVVPLAARPVTLLTYDTGQSMRARAAGLGAVKLAQSK